MVLSLLSLCGFIILYNLLERKGRFLPVLFFTFFSRFVSQIFCCSLGNEIRKGEYMYIFLRAFIDFFFFPLKAMTIDNNLYVVIYVVVIVLAVYGFVRRLFRCI